MVLTVITVSVAFVNLGALNSPVDRIYALDNPWQESYVAS